MKHNMRNAWRLVAAILLATNFTFPQTAVETPANPHPKSPASPQTSLLPQKQAWTILSDGVADRHAEKRQAALIALSTLGPSERALHLVFSDLGDKDPGVRQTAVTALGEMNSRRAIPALKQSLEDDSAAVRFAAAKALWKMGDHSGRDLIEQILAKQSTTSDGILRESLTDANKKLHSPGDLAKVGLTEATGAFLGPFSYGVVVAEELAKDKGAPTRAASASLLASDHTAKSVRALQDAMQDDNAAVRIAAAKAMGNHPCKQVLPDLKFLFDDKDPVKYMAAASLIRVESKLQSKSADRECDLLNQNLAQAD